MAFPRSHLRAMIPALLAGFWMHPGQALAKVEARFAAEQDLATVAAAELATARYRVDAVLPDLGDEALVDQLVALADRKIQVRIVVPAGGPGAKCGPCDRLELHGADVRRSDTRLLHRFVVIDGPRGKKASGVLGRLVVMSGALMKNRDASLVTLEREGDFVLSYQSEFNFLWEKTRDHDDKAKRDRVYPVSAPAVPYALFSSANMVPLELDGGWLLSPSLDRPQGTIARYLSGAIDLSYDQVLVSAPALKSLEVYQSLTRALERGVQVRLLVDATQRGLETSSLPGCLALPRASYRLMDECLAKLGADVRYAKDPVRTGFVMIDGKTVHTGNFRLSRAAEFKALGNLMTLRGDIVRSFTRHFESTFAAARPSVSPRGPKTMTSLTKGCVPIRPAALTFEELQKWRAIYQRGMCE